VLIVLVGLAVAVGVFVAGLATNRPEADNPALVADSRRDIGFRIAGQNQLFQSLADAVAAAADNDTIEVHLDGPFPSPPLRFDGKRLTIRAADGAQPVFLMEAPNRPDELPFVTTDSDLRLEGLSIYWTISAPMGTTETDMLSRCVVTSRGGRVDLVHCRIVAGRMNGCLGVSGRDVESSHCHFAAENGGGIFWNPAPGGKLTVENCLFERGAAISIMAAAETSNAPGAVLTLTRNTFATERSFQIALFAGPKQPLEFHARNNLFDGVQLFGLLGLFLPRQANTLEPDAMIDLFRSFVTWSEEGNVHRRGAQYLVVQRRGATVSADIESVAGWLALWGMPPDQSVEGTIRFRERESTSVAEPLRLDQVDDASGAVPAAVGADPDRLGPAPVDEAG
jgi:hypothetical protein